MKIIKKIKRIISQYRDYIYFNIWYQYKTILDNIYHWGYGINRIIKIYILSRVFEVLSKFTKLMEIINEYKKSISESKEGNQNK